MEKADDMVRRKLITQHNSDFSNSVLEKGLKLKVLKKTYSCSFPTLFFVSILPKKCYLSAILVLSSKQLSVS